MFLQTFRGPQTGGLNREPVGCGGSPFANGKETIVIVLGLILALIGLVAGINILVTIGIILLVVGLILMLLGSTGRMVGPRRHYW